MIYNRKRDQIFKIPTIYALLQLIKMFQIFCLKEIVKLDKRKPKSTILIKRTDRQVAEFNQK